MHKERITYLVILLLISIVLTSSLRNEADFIPFESRKFWIDKTKKTDRYPVVFAGDSRIYRGISPDEFEEHYPGMKGINLGYSAHGYREEYLDFIEKRLDTLANKPLIIMGISAAPFCERALKARNFIWEYKGRKKETVLEYRYLYIITKSFAAFNIEKKIRDKDKKHKGVTYQQTFHSNGWVESHRLDTDTSFYNDWYSKMFIGNPFNREKTDICLDKVEEWTKQGIRVVGFRTPTSYSIKMMEDTISDFPLDSFKTEFIKRGASWIDVDRRKYQTYDGSHLDYNSTLQLSRDLAVSIKELLSEDS